MPDCTNIANWIFTIKHQSHELLSELTNLYETALEDIKPRLMEYVDKSGDKNGDAFLEVFGKKELKELTPTHESDAQNTSYG